MQKNDGTQLPSLAKSEMTRVEKQNMAWASYNLLIDAFVNQAKLFLYIGKLAKDIRDKKLYKFLGNGGYDTFGMFLKSPEISRLAPSTVMAYIRIYEYYIERLQIIEGEILEVGTNRLQKLLPKLKNKPDAEAREIIKDIGVLTHDDYKKEVRERGLDTNKPLLYQDKETGLYIFEFEPNQMLRVYNRESNEVIFGLPFDKTQ